MANFNLLKSNIAQTSNPSYSFYSVWKKHKAIHKVTSIEDAVAKTGTEMRHLLKEGKTSGEKLAKEVLHYVNSSKITSDVDIKTSISRQLLLEVVDILAALEIDDRDLFRMVLGALLILSGAIDREVFLFDHAKTHATEWNNGGRKLVERKQSWVLRQVAGWKCHVPISQNTQGYNDKEYYLDLPFKRSIVGGTTTVMAEAMYCLQDAEMVLSLLRHGMNPASMYLWPLSIVLDLRHTLIRGGLDTTALGTGYNEAQIIRYYCRARTHFRMVPFDSDLANDVDLNSKDLDTETLLLIPSSAHYLLPDDRYKNPSLLMHQCRAAIRRRLLEVDNLPRGIYKLPLPKRMKSYIDLLLD